MDCFAEVYSKGTGGETSLPLAGSFSLGNTVPPQYRSIEQFQRGSNPSFRRSALFPVVPSLSKAKAQTHLPLPGQSAAVDVPFRNKAAADSNRGMD